MLQVVPPAPCAPCELLPCPAAANRARRLCSINEDICGKLTAGVVNPGAGSGAGAGAGTGADAGAGVLPNRTLRDVPDEVMSELFDVHIKTPPPDTARSIY